MKVKIHLSGVAIKYDPCKRVDRVLKLESRSQGSLYSWQKRKIADACAWMLYNSDCPLIFCLTSPGETSLANSTNVLSKFINNAKKNHGLKDYVWVREFTKKGFPHFHFVADWLPVEHWFKRNDNGETNINRISRYWSGLFGSDASNSIRLGSYHPVTKRRCYYLEHKRQVHYLAKYIGKNIGTGSSDYLSEAGFPSLCYNKTIRSFCVSPKLAANSAPKEFESFAEYTFVKKPVYTTTGIQLLDVPVRMDRSWGDSNFSIRDNVLKRYRWKNTGHGQTYIGYLKEKSQ